VAGDTLHPCGVGKLLQGGAVLPIAVMDPVLPGRHDPHDSIVTFRVTCIVQA